MINYALISIEKLNKMYENHKIDVIEIEKTIRGIGLVCKQKR